MSAPATKKVPKNFLDMYFLMSTNPNYKEMQHMTFNKKTGLIDDGTKKCNKCLEIIPLVATICPNCKEVLI
jgi:hypothetical protein